MLTLLTVVIDSVCINVSFCIKYSLSTCISTYNNMNCHDNNTEVCMLLVYEACIRGSYILGGWMLVSKTHTTGFSLLCLTANI